MSQRHALLLVFAGSLFACQPSSAANPDGDATATATAAPVETSEPAPSVTASATSAETAGTASAPPADTRVKDACTKLCERVKSSCPAGRGDACALQCKSYEAKSKGCEAETEAALTCQAGAPGGFCDNVAAPKCADAFLNMQRCQRGEAPKPVATGKAGLPDGWERVSDETWGLSFAMPKGAAVDKDAKSRTWKITADGATYEVMEQARPKKLDEQALVKLIIGHVGVSCQKEMRVVGRVDLETVTFSRFETGCGKGGKLYGKVRVDDKRGLTFVVRGEAKPELREAFLEGAQPLKP